MKKNKNVIAYTRVSTKDQKEHGYSLKDQKYAIERFCESEEMNIVKFYVEDHSAKNFDRPEYIKMLQYLKNNYKDINYILVHKWDRFSRNTTESYSEIKKLRKLGIEVNCIDSWIDYEIPESSFMLGMQLINSEVENRKISNRTKSGTRRALLEGHFTNRPPLGYMPGVDEVNKNLMKPHPENSILVEGLFLEYSTGLYTQQEILKKYKEKGLNINKSTLSRLLENILYMGKIYVKEYKDEPAQIVQGKHRALVSEEIFYKVQNVKNGLKIDKRNNKKNNSNFPLTGFLECSECGGRIYGSETNNGNSKRFKKYYYYYQCNSGSKCRRYVNNIIHNALIEELKKIKPSKGIEKLFEQMLVDEYKRVNKNRINELDRLQKEFDKKNESRKKIVFLLVDGSIGKEEFDIVNNSLKEELQNLEMRKIDLMDYKKDLNYYVSFGLSLIENLDKIYEKCEIELQRKLLGSIFSEKLVFENNSFRTLKYNEAIKLFTLYSNGLAGLGNKKGDSKIKVSHSVPGVGIEPTLLGTRV